ncbi:hypothetical protein HAX54_023553 [Datura stramonium]|uniref:Uncharacterized protein n=1 Tax=Datura stramonium TaxID=4076 RepID=A0ABS8UXY0_DATST|nr:hypothetical protein [Datura stramonium]
MVRIWTVDQEPTVGRSPASLEMEPPLKEGEAPLNEESTGKLTYANTITAHTTANLNPIRHEMEKVKARQSTHNGMPAVIFKTSDYYDIMANECRTRKLSRENHSNQTHVRDTLIGNVSRNTHEEQQNKGNCAQEIEEGEISSPSLPSNIKNAEAINLVIEINREKHDALAHNRNDNQVEEGISMESKTCGNKNRNSNTTNQQQKKWENYILSLRTPVTAKL